MLQYPRLLIFYALWAFCAIGISLFLAGLTPASVTRLLVLAFLFVQFLTLPLLTRIFPRGSPQIRFVALSIILASIVEGFHMISKPVFDSLLISRQTPLATALFNYGIDLLFTIPAYVIIFSVIWIFICHHHFPFWHYVFIIGIAQMLGDGGMAYFFSSPWMLLFLPYPLSSYHAMNIIPFLAVRDHLQVDSPPSARVFLALPVIVSVYFVCGAVIQILGKYLSLQ